MIEGAKIICEMRNDGIEPLFWVRDVDPDKFSDNSKEPGGEDAQKDSGVDSFGNNGRCNDDAD